MASGVSFDAGRLQLASNVHLASMPAARLDHTAIELHKVTPIMLLIGVILVLFAWLPGEPFRLEQYDLPKDIAFAALGATCGLSLMFSRDQWINLRVDAPMIAVIAWGSVLGQTVAIDVHAGWRLTGCFAAGALAFFSARRVGATSIVTHVHTALCGVIVVLFLLVLFEGFGILEFISAPGRRPGATLGNRNLAARVACLSLPLMWRLIVAAKQRIATFFFAVAVALSAAAIAMSRSRGAWLVSGCLLLVLPTVITVDRHYGKTVASRTYVWAMAAVVGAAFALFVPNRLGWRPSDFGNSAARLLDYRFGTGRGRLLQAQTSWRMIQAMGLEGVAPGNWSILYPRFATTDDPSVNANAFYPGPQVPRNDLLPFTAEYGVGGLVLAFVAIALGGRRAARMLVSRDDTMRECGVVIISVGCAALALGFFDSVFRVAPTLMLLAVRLGLFVGEANARLTTAPRDRPGGTAARSIVVGLTFASIVFGVSSTRDFLSFRIIRTLTTLDDLYRAVRIAPTNIEARMLLSFALLGAKRCDLAEPHLAAAARLQPWSGAVRNVRLECERIGAFDAPRF